MTDYTDRWLLPDGVEEILPSYAQKVEQSRRRLLDIYQLWGYQLVIPPLLEFTDSLLTGVGDDLDLLTVKITDQLSGRTMGLRSDITPQAARIDAHSLKCQGVSRLCYAGTVVHAKPQFLQAVRTPFYTGVELFGEAGLNADVEVILLLLESLNDTIDVDITIDFGHVSIYRALVNLAGFNPDQESQLFKLLQTKAITDIESWLSRQTVNDKVISWLLALPDLSGDRSILDKAREQLADAPAQVLDAINQLTHIADIIQVRYPKVNLYFDLSELRGYHYHTGIVFAAYAPGMGNAIANGGRYDSIGKVFGRSRSATGFSINLTAIMPLLKHSKTTHSIHAPFTNDHRQWQAIQALRQAGETVICGFSEKGSNDSLSVEESKTEEYDHHREFVCDRKLVLEEGEYKVRPLINNTSGE